MFLKRKKYSNFNFLKTKAMKKAVFILIVSGSFLAFNFQANASNSRISTSVVVKDSADLKELVGIYDFKDKGVPFDSIEITVKEAGKIHIVAGERILDVVPLADKVDAFETPEANLYFVRDAQKKVVSLKLVVGDDTIEGPKNVK